MLFSCDSDESNTNAIENCSNYPDWSQSPYVLPFPVGLEYRISQGNCTSFSHQGTLRYSYDIEMPFGSVITAASEGVVYGLRMNQPEGTRGLRASNYIQIKHTDNRVSDYVHLRAFTNVVNIGDSVKRGDTLALTGDTGDVGTWPHLHFNITSCGDNLSCNTEPVTFINTKSNSRGLQEDEIYRANEY